MSFMKSDPEISLTFAKATFFCYIRNELHKITCPIDILYCTQDIIVPMEVIDFMRENIANCRTIKLDATGHYPQITNPAALVDAINQIIKESL